MSGCESSPSSPSTMALTLRRTPGSEIAERNDLWLLNLALVLAQELVPGFMLDVGERQGARTWDSVAQARLIADIEAVKLDGKKACGDYEACVRLVTRSEKRPEYKELYGKNPNNQSAHKRADSLNSRLSEARKRSLIGRLLANAENETKQQLIDGVISLFGSVPADRKAAKARVDSAGLTRLGRTRQSKPREKPSRN